MDFPKASILRRSMAFFIDCLLLDLVGEVVTYPFVKKFDLKFDEVIGQLLSGSAELERILVFLFLYTSFLTILWGFYFIYFTGSTGQTLGKKWLGLRVVRVDGKSMDFKTALNRFVGYGFSSIFLLGFLWAWFDKNRQAWHDKMANTIVVKPSITSH